MKRFVLVFLAFGTVDGLAITRSPQSMRNATIGDIVSFECRLNSKSAHPGWGINGTDYQITDLPLGYSYKEETFTKSLVVGPLVRSMNNTCYYCYIITFGGRYESSRAYLVMEYDTGSDTANSSSRISVTTLWKSEGMAISNTARSADVVPLLPTRPHRASTTKAGVIVAAAVILLSSLLIIAVALIIRKKKKKGKNSPETMKQPGR
ncbi:hypothetical protein GBAR_LOCUS26223 [Geodia barretti]|uniref:Uncharacterized protein n=1 Tax=Geodia barretti TaxID=519541 RepID=A0AA35XE47_GEOBA|nr:hypothetical protein GBAR_LOCUS26223 [Geodia barretti]